MTLAAEQPSVSTRRFGVARLAERFGVTEGQGDTLAIGLVIGITTAPIGIPPTLPDHPQLRAALRAGPPSARGTTSVAAPATPPAHDVSAPVAGSYAPPALSSGSSSFS